MRQALHIFRKDTRRLWVHIALLAVLFAVYAFFSPETSLTGITALFDWGGVPALLIVLACWTLGVSSMHEDAAAHQSPFWLTRPYSRRSLVAAKVLFLFAFVFVPLLISGIVLEARAGVGIIANFGALMTHCIVRWLWLILPAVAVGVLTQNLMEFAAGLSTLLIVLLISQSHGIGEIANLLTTPWQFSGNVAAVLPMVMAAIAVVVLQYALRRTQWNRGFLLAGVLISGILAPMEGVARFSVRAANPGVDTSPIQVDFDRSAPTEWVSGVRTNPLNCIAVPLVIKGLPADTILRPARGASGVFRSRLRGTYAVQYPDVKETIHGFREIVCQEGPAGVEKIELQTTLRFDVVRVSPLAEIPVKLGELSANGAGRCEIDVDINTRLRCTLAEPVNGIVTAGMEFPGYQLFAKSQGRGGPIRLSPVLQMKFDGQSTITPSGWPFDQALKRSDARFILRTEKVIGSISRSLTYVGLMQPWMWNPAVPPPPPPNPRLAR